MAKNWVKVGTDIGIGAAVGVVDQLAANQDAGRLTQAGVKLDKNGELPFFSRLGTYVNYVAPIAAVVAASMDWVEGDMETRVLTAAGQLAGRGLTQHLTKAKTTVPTKTSGSPAAYTQWMRDTAAREAAPRTNQREFSSVGSAAW